MKTRKGFVSNSSSSSFICNICGKSEGGYDISLDDAGMCGCEGGHVFHYRCLKSVQKKTGIDSPESRCEELQFEFCPVCTLKFIVSSDELKFLMKEYSLTSDGILKMVNDKFETYEKFIEYINKKEQG
jgi:hypothetical protein